MKLMELVEEYGNAAIEYSKSTGRPQGIHTLPKAIKRLSEVKAKIQAIADSIEWIPVSERLPEEGFSHCLFYSETEKMYSVGGMYKGVLQVNDEELSGKQVTHWKYNIPPKEKTS